jgi:uncharacterized protein YndB with AHSA1/START domain
MQSLPAVLNLRIPIKASMPLLYDAWTTSTGLEKWFLRKALFTAPSGGARAADQQVQAGDQYEWLWYGHPDETVEKDRIIQANGSNLLRFGFGKSGIVTVELLVEEHETVCVLLQENFPVAEHASTYLDCQVGWVFYLTNLKSFLEGGIDLRNRNEKLKRVINS